MVLKVVKGKLHKLLVTELTDSVESYVKGSWQQVSLLPLWVLYPLAHSVSGAVTCLLHAKLLLSARSRTWPSYVRGLHLQLCRICLSLSTLAVCIAIDKDLEFPACTGGGHGRGDDNRDHTKIKTIWEKIESIQGKGSVPQTIIFMLSHKNSVH